MGNIACLYEGEEMSAFDSALLMIDDLARKNIELEQKIWELQLAHWHAGTMFNVRDYCKLEECNFCSTHIRACVFVNEAIDEA
jgi:hypothetical protein